MPGGLGDVPAVNDDVGDVLAEDPRGRNLAEGKLHGMVEGTVGLPCREQPVRRLPVGSVPVVADAPGLLPVPRLPTGPGRELKEVVQEMIDQAAHVPRSAGGRQRGLVGPNLGDDRARLIERAGEPVDRVLDFCGHSRLLLGLADGLDATVPAIPAGRTRSRHVEARPGREH